MLLRHNTNTITRLSRSRAAVRVLASDGLYGILGVTNTATQEEIRAAYKRLAHSLHPDKHLQKQVDTTAAFVKCKLAYEILADRQRRQQYDKEYLHTSTQQGLHNQASTSAPKHSSASWHANNAVGTVGWSSDVTAAAVAAGTGSSGLSPHIPGGTAQQPALATCGVMPITRDRHQVPQHTAAEAVREVLLQHHGVALEQFHSMQEALEFLQQLEQQEALLGLAAEDYIDGQEAPYRDKLTAQGTAAHDQQQLHWGNFNPGAFAPLSASDHRP